VKFSKSLGLFVFLIFCSSFFSLLLSTGANEIRAEDSLKKKVLFIGIDGTRYDAIETAEATQLLGLAKEGIHSSHCLILGDRYQKNDTISGPGWSSILTGVWADKHGVHDNSFDGRDYEHFPHLFTLAKQVNPQLSTASYVTWEPIHKFIVSAADESLSFEEKQHGVLDYDRYDDQATAAAIERLKSSDPDVLFLYLGQVDVAGHNHGFHPSVKEYIDAILRVDAKIEKVLAAVKHRKTYEQEDWIVIVTSDHGGKGTGHGGGHKEPQILNSFLIVSGPSAQRGEFQQQTYIVDAPVTALKHLGIEINPDWNLDGQPVGLK
jgi:predicted AlkP superfamily pyrophosphatase or phosphodiesterase